MIIAIPIFQSRQHNNQRYQAAALAWQRECRMCAFTLQEQFQSCFVGVDNGRELDVEIQVSGGVGEGRRRGSEVRERRIKNLIKDGTTGDACICILTRLHTHTHKQVCVCKWIYKMYIIFLFLLSLHFSLLSWCGCVCTHTPIYPHDIIGRRVHKYNLEMHELWNPHSLPRAHIYIWLKDSWRFCSTACETTSVPPRWASQRYAAQTFSDALRLRDIPRGSVMIMLYNYHLLRARAVENAYDMNDKQPAKCLIRIKRNINKNKYMTKKKNIHQEPTATRNLFIHSYLLLTRADPCYPRHHCHPRYRPGRCRYRTAGHVVARRRI